MIRPVAAVAACLMGMTLTSAVLAQAPKSSVDVSATTGQLEFKDPKTGQVWTPENVGQSGGPIGPDDKAFDPLDQKTPRQSVIQKAVAKPVGSVPITAGPTVPILDLQNLTLRVLPGKRWQVAMYINNNSGNAVQPIVDCRFTNSGQLVTQTQATISQIGPGVRAGVVVMGPRAEIFVDKANCAVVSP